MVKVPNQWRGRTDSTVPFGLKDGRLWFVSDVPSGLDCGCRCPDPTCDMPLIARNRPSPDRQRAYNFMHSTRTTTCGGRESALHRMAKELLLGAKTLMLPEWTDGELSIPASELVLDQCAAREVRLLDGQMRPDVQVGGRLDDVALPRLFVEVKVSHAVDWKKAAVAHRNGISMIEIDLSNATDEDAQDQDRFMAMVLGSIDNRTWVNLGDAQFLAATLGQDVFEVRSTDTFPYDVLTKNGNTLQFTKQRGILHRAGEESRAVDFEIADTYRDGHRTDGLGNKLPYEPGMYARASAPPTAWSWQGSQFYKTFLRPLSVARKQRQSQLFNNSD